MQKQLSVKSLGGEPLTPLKRREDVLECCINIGCASWVEGSRFQHNKPDIPSPPDHKQDLAALAGASLSLPTRP